MKQAYRNWLLGFAAVVVLLLAACAAVVYTVDPALYYRMPEDGRTAYFSERYQSAGLAKNVPADTVLIGTSMASNYRAGRIGEVFGGAGLRITLPDGYLSEFDKVMETLMYHQSPERVIFVLDLNIMIRDESGVTDLMPEYLYNQNPLDDIQYLLNKDNLYYSFFNLMSRKWGTLETLDESFVWDEGVWWDHQAALMFYQRPERAAQALPADAYLENVRSNLEVLESWILENPDTEFRLFLSPYSMLFWDKAQRLGETEALLTAMEQICQALTAHENVMLFGYLMDTEFVEDLDNYCDHIHHSTEMGERLLAKLAAEEGQLTEENLAGTIANWREFVVNYDYEKFWDDAFWAKWVADKAAKAAS